MRNLIPITLIALGAGFISCDEPNEIAKEPFVGKWLIAEVALDGTMQDGWTDLEIQIEQDSVNSGSYSMINTPDESVWKKKGVWTKHPSGFVRDHNTQVVYSVIDGELMMLFNIWRPQEPCLEDVCVPVVKGDWLFTAKKL